MHGRTVLVLVTAVLAVASIPAAAEAARRPGAPKASLVLRAIADVAKATPFASGRKFAQSARKAFAGKRYCAASDALAKHRTLVAKQLKRAGKGRRRALVKRLRALDGRSVKARGLVLRSLSAGKACGGQPAMGVDAAIKPRSKLPAIGGSGPRPIARMIDAYGQAVDFVANELLVTGSEAEVNALVKRWRGKILGIADLTKLGAKEKQYLIRINTAKADETTLSADLAALSEVRGGTATVSSEQGLDLLAAAGREARRGTDVGINFIGEGSAIAAGTSYEWPNGPGGFATTGSGWSVDAFNWKHLSASSTQGVGTAEAWRLLARSGRSSNKVGLAVLDMGYSLSANGPDFGAPLTALSNVPFTDALETANLLSCGGGSPCPWHGTNVANTAFAVPDNNLGVAGTGGPVARRIVIFTLYDFFTSINALVQARAFGARVLNMSYGARVPAALAWSVLPFEAATRAARASGMVLMAAAGNDGKNVDATDCFIVCWEEAWWTPCENGGVFCVGALEHDSVSRASYSNFGKQGGQVELFAPGKVLVGLDPSTPLGSGQIPTIIRAVQGTSFASPYLAGVAALVRSANPGLGAGDVERLLVSTAKTSTDAKVGRYVNALAAVRRALPRLINIEEPIDGGPLSKGGAIRFSAFVHDPSRASPSSITWTLANGTVIGTRQSFSTSSLPYGPHVVTARAAFPGGAVTDQVRFTITNTPPTVRIQQPVTGSTFFQNEQVPLTGESGDVNQPESGNRLRDEQVAWFLDGSSAPFATAHNATLSLTGVTTGPHTVTMRGTDDAGASVTDSITVQVAPPSANPPPSVSITSPANGSFHPPCAGCTEPPPDNRAYANVDFQANVSDPNGDPLTYTWTETVPPGGMPQVRSTLEDPGVLRVYSGTCDNSAKDWTLSVSDGTSTRSAIVRIFVGPSIC